MKIALSNPYTLPTIEFVGGATQDFVFRCYFDQNKKPFDLSTCTANFALIDYVNKTGEPLLSKSMTIGAETDDEGAVQNILSVTLDATDTVEMAGKYIYQITVKDVTGEVDIPNQGIIHIIRNINKAYAK